MAVQESWAKTGIVWYTTYSLGKLTSLTNWKSCSKTLGNMLSRGNWTRSLVWDSGAWHINIYTRRDMKPYQSILISERYTDLLKLSKFIGCQVKLPLDLIEVYLSTCYVLFLLTLHISNSILRPRLCSTQHNQPRSPMKKPQKKKDRPPWKVE